MRTSGVKFLCVISNPFPPPIITFSTLFCPSPFIILLKVYFLIHFQLYHCLERLFMETLSSEVQKLIDEGDYKAAKELFVINETPSNLLEVNAVVFMAIPFYILYQYVFAFCIKKNVSRSPLQMISARFSIDPYLVSHFQSQMHAVFDWERFLCPLQSSPYDSPPIPNLLLHRSFDPLHDPCGVS